jgi:hypothetical protein
MTPRGSSEILAEFNDTIEIEITKRLYSTQTVDRFVHMYILRKSCGDVIILHCGQSFLAPRHVSQHFSQ